LLISTALDILLQAGDILKVISEPRCQLGLLTQSLRSWCQKNDSFFFVSCASDICLSHDKKQIKQTLHTTQQTC